MRHVVVFTDGSIRKEAHDLLAPTCEVRVLRASGNGFDEAAITAARGIRFQPAERGGKPVAVWIPWTMKFRLDS